MKAKITGMNGGLGYTISDVAGAVKGRLLGNTRGTNPVRLLLIDSRRLVYPEGSLFFAIKTRNNNGHLYIGELLSKGVRSFVAESFPRELSSKYPEASFVIVNDSLDALRSLASAHRSKFPVPVLAITGSNGKTVVKEWMFQLLCTRHNIVKNPKSYNSQIGVPLSVWLMDKGHDMAVFEAGISRTGEMERLASVIRPTIGLFTNIGPAHDEGFQSREEKIREKLKLFRGCSSLVYCSDHEMVHKEVSSWHRSNSSVTLFTWGSTPGCDIIVKGCREKKGKSILSLLYRGRISEFVIPFTDRASIENAMHCIAFLKLSVYDDEFIAKGISALQPVAMRLEMKEGVNQSLIINDSYNSDLHSLEIALDFMAGHSHHRKKTLILSDILQSGIPPGELYPEVASLLETKQVDRLIGIGPDISSQAGSFTLPASFYEDTESFIAKMTDDNFHREAILLKGARSFGFERLSQLLQQKDHQTTLEIDLDALVHNLNVFRSLLGPGTGIMGVVKAFSYGSGSVEVARVLQFHNVDCLAVAYADEGRELRQGGVKLPILVMNPEIRSFDTLFDFGLEPEIYGLPLLERFTAAIRAARGRHGKDHRVHIKIDSGMHRLGFMEDQVDELLAVLRRTPEIRVASVFSHFAASEDPRHDAFTQRQTDVFRDICDRMRKELGYDFRRHICNSAAISRFPGAHFDMVRLGIGLYGVSGDRKLQPLLHNVSSFRSVVSQVKTIKAGETIGYGREGVVQSDMELAIIPVGYADGLDRRLGNGRGRLLVKGKRVAVVGNISMDMCALDVTGLGVREGDEVTVFGPGLPVTQIADYLGTIPYEVFTSVSGRVKRIYYQ